MRNLSVIKGLYQGNGVTRRWAIPFEYNDTAQIFVTITTFDEGDYTYRVLDRTEYTIDEDSVEIVYPKTDDDAPIPSTQYLTVWRDTDLLQLMDLTNQGAAWPDSIEASLDKLHQIVQELAEGLSRSLKVDIGDPQTPDEKLVAIQDYVLAAAESSRSASSSAVSANQAAESAATSAANAAESERLAGGYADTASDAASRAEDSAISARAYNAPDYNNETTYQAGAVVTFTDGNSYRALQETTGNAPTNIIYWQKVTDYVGDDFFEVDEYGYIVPMDSPSHSRYWRVDQNGYIVPVEGGDGGYRPDTRSLSAEYLNVTNEGYIKHLRADDVSAQDFSATGNVTAGMVTTPQANVTTMTANALTANTANVTALTAGTLTANDIIAKGPVVDVRAFGAKGDGVTDDTAAIQAAIDNGDLVLIPSGNYYVNASQGLKLHSNMRLVLSQNAKITVIPSSSPSYNLIDIRDVENVIIAGGVLEGDKYTHTGSGGEWGFGVAIRNSKNVRVINVKILKMWGDGIYIGSTQEDDESYWSSEIEISNCEIADCRRQGISVVAGNNTTISHCYIHNISGTAPEAGIDVEPNGTIKCKNILIQSCRITENDGNAITTWNNNSEYVVVDSCFCDNIRTGENSPIKAINVTFNKDKVSLLKGNTFFESCEIYGIHTVGGRIEFYNCRIGGVSYDAKTEFSGLKSDDVKTGNMMIIMKDCYVQSINTSTQNSVDILEISNCTFNNWLIEESDYNHILNIGVTDRAYFCDNVIYSGATKMNGLFYFTGGLSKLVFERNSLNFNQVTERVQNTAMVSRCSELNIIRDNHFSFPKLATGNLIYFPNNPSKLIYQNNIVSYKSTNTAIANDGALAASTTGTSINVRNADIKIPTA